MPVLKLFSFIAGFAGTLEITQGGQDVLGLHISSVWYHHTPFLFFIIVLPLCIRNSHQNNFYFLYPIPSFLTPPPAELESYSSFS